MVPGKCRISIKRDKARKNAGKGRYWPFVVNKGVEYSFGSLWAN